MKRIILIITVTAVFLTTLITSAQARGREVHGLAIGGGTGAVVGHAIGRNPEAAIIGATVGGVIGLIVAGEIDRHHRGSNHNVRRVFAPPHRERHPQHPRVQDERYYDRDFGGPVYRDHFSRGRGYHSRRHHIDSGCRIDHRRPFKKHHRGHNRNRYYR